MTQLIIERNNVQALDLYIRRKENEYKKHIGYLTDDGRVYLNIGQTTLSAGILRLLFAVKQIRQINVSSESYQSHEINLKSLESHLELPYDNISVDLNEHIKK
jgi:hypothetical protein